MENILNRCAFESGFFVKTEPKMRWDWSLKVESNMYFPKGNYLGLDLKTLLQPWGSGDVNLGFDLTRVVYYSNIDGTTV